MTTPTPVSNLIVRKGQRPGEQSVPFQVDFTAGTDTSYLFDPTQVQLQQVFGLPRSIYIDNRNGSEQVSIYCSITGQTSGVPPYSLGFIPLSCVQQSKILLTSKNNTNNQCYIEVYNYEIPPVLWNGIGPYVPGQTTAVDGEDETNIMSPTNPFAVAPKDCETVAYARVDLTTLGGSTALVAAGGTPLFVTLTNAGDLTGATAGGPAYVKVGAAAVAEQGRLLMPGTVLTLPYRTKLAINGIVDAAGNPTSILVETAH